MVNRILFKGLALTALIFFSYSAQASHYSAGEVFYQWIGNEPGKGQYDYRVFATIYRNVGGVQIGTGNLSACAFRASNRSATTPFSMTYQNPNAPLNPNYRITSTNVYGWYDIGVHPNDNNGWDIPAFEGCALSPKDISEYRYVGEVTLTGKAADWRFAIDPPCCRDQNDNLAGGGDLYIEVDLNNTKGPNSSPRIITPAARTFCVITDPAQQPFRWYQTAGEEDGDSLRYGFYGAGSQSGGCGSNPNSINYAAGYSASAPLASNPPVTIDQQRGIFTLKPTTAGAFVVKIEVRELRFDTVSLQWLYIGNTVRELQVPIAPACLASTADGPELDVSAPNVSTQIWTKAMIDSAKTAYNVGQLFAADSTMSGGTFNNFVMPVYSGYNCFNGQITLDFDVAVMCDSVTPTDFRLIGPDGVSRPIDSVDTKCAINGVTNSLDLHLFKPLDVDGNYLLQIRTGLADNNTLLNECGYAIRAFYSAIVSVTGCPAPEYELNNVSVEDDIFVKLKWGGNQDLLDANVQNSFNQWSILRREKGQTNYQLVGVANNPLARQFTDSMQLNGYYVDNFTYEYAVSLVYNSKGRPYTRYCNTVQLRVDSSTTNEDKFSLYWNRYDCIPDSLEEFRFYEGKVDTSNNSVNWALISTTTDTFASNTKPMPDSLTEGVYAAKVVAGYNNGQSDSSESNWVYYAINYFPPPPPPPETGPLVIPNVITPNGDGVNDRFYINPPVNGRQYEEISVVVYNRWGNKVFEDPAFHSRNTQAAGWAGTGTDGNTLADGTYFYVIELKDLVEGTTRTERGNINIMTTLK